MLIFKPLPKNCSRCLEPVQELFRDSWTGVDGVVPLWADAVASQLKGFELGLRDFQAGLVLAIEMGCGDLQARLGRRAANETQHQLQCAQDMARPSRGDLTEKSVLNRIPFRGPRGVVADPDLQPALVREVLQPLLVAS